MLTQCQFCKQVIEIATLGPHLREECEAAGAKASTKDLTPSQCPLCLAEVGTSEEDWRRHILQEGCAAWNGLLSRRVAFGQGRQSATSQVLRAGSVFRAAGSSPANTGCETLCVVNFFRLCTRVLALELRFRIHCTDLRRHVCRGALRQWMSFIRTAVARTCCMELVPRVPCRKGATLGTLAGVPNRGCFAYGSQPSLMTSQVSCSTGMPSHYLNESVDRLHLKSCAGLPLARA